MTIRVVVKKLVRVRPMIFPESWQQIEKTHRVCRCPVPEHSLRSIEVELVVGETIGGPPLREIPLEDLKAARDHQQHDRDASALGPSMNLIQRPLREVDALLGLRRKLAEVDLEELPQPSVLGRQPGNVPVLRRRDAPLEDPDELRT